MVRGKYKKTGRHEAQPDQKTEQSKINADSRKLNPVIQTEFGPKRLSVINGILLDSIWQIWFTGYEAFRMKGISLQLYKNPAKRDKLGRMYTCVTIYFLRKGPAHNDSANPIASYIIPLISCNIPRTKKEVKSEIQKYMIREYGGIIPYTRYCSRQRDTPMTPCACLLILAVIIIVIHYLLKGIASII